jgi:hypothetical protein
MIKFHPRNPLVNAAAFWLGLYMFQIARETYGLSKKIYLGDSTLRAIIMAVCGMFFVFVMELLLAWCERQVEVTILRERRYAEMISRLAAGLLLTVCVAMPFIFAHVQA